MVENMDFRGNHGHKHCIAERQTLGTGASGQMTVYLLSFLEGIITFISPCLLPMLPIYITYFTGQDEKSDTLKNAAGFVLGFSLVFILLGAFAGSLGSLLLRHQAAVNIVTGLAIVILGLNFLEVLRIPFLNTTKRLQFRKLKSGFFSSVVFGVVFSIGWTPCVGAFLGSALMLAAGSGETLKGILLLAAYSLGLGIPFILSALLIERLKSGFDFIKKHYKLVNAISGLILVLSGIMMMTGLFGRLLAALSF